MLRVDMEDSSGPKRFGRAIFDLLSAAGVTVDGLVASRGWNGPQRSAIYDWMNGRHLPGDVAQFLFVVRFCRERAESRGVPTLDEGAFLKLLADAKGERSADPDTRTATGTGSLHYIAQCDPTVLGVHKAIDGRLPRYVRRVHDDVLDALLDPTVAANRLIVLRGGSSTGKTRSAYEAVKRQLPLWPVLCPRTNGALTRLLREGVPGRSVLWLNELRHYVEDPGGSEALFELADLLSGRNHVVAITAVWPEYWAAYVAGHSGGPGTADRARAARELLAPLPEAMTSVKPDHGAVVDVPDHFVGDELAGALVDDIEGAARAGLPGRLAQYFAGVPDLLQQYEGPGADPYGSAMIAAALDAARLGHVQPLPREFLQDAAVGYLGTAHRANALAGWREAAWEHATRTLKGAVQALRPVPPDDGVGVVGYRPADYLEQYAVVYRREQIPPPAFWTAAAAHAHPGGLDNLAREARDRGLYREAARLYKRSTTPGAANALIDLLRDVDPADRRAAAHAATTVALDSWQLIFLIRRLREIGAEDELAVLLARRPAAAVDISKPVEVFYLLRELHEIGASEHIDELVSRNPAIHIDLTDLGWVIRLLKALRAVGAEHQVTTVLEREPALRADFGNLWVLEDEIEGYLDDDVAALVMNAIERADPRLQPRWIKILDELWQEHKPDEAASMCERVIAAADLSDPLDVAEVLEDWRFDGRHDLVTLLLRRNPAECVNLDDPYHVDALMSVLRESGAELRDRGMEIGTHGLRDGGETLARLLEDHATVLAERALAYAEHLDVDRLTRLLEVFIQPEDDRRSRTLAAEEVERIDLTNTGQVANLLYTLRGGDWFDPSDETWADGLGRSFAKLLDRGPARNAGLLDANHVAHLLSVLHEVSLDDHRAAIQMAALLDRRPAEQVDVTRPAPVMRLAQVLKRVGATDQAALLMEREAAEHDPIADQHALRDVMNELDHRPAPQDESIAAIAFQAAPRLRLDSSYDASKFLAALRQHGETDAADALVTRLPAARNSSCSKNRRTTTQSSLSAAPATASPPSAGRGMTCSSLSANHPPIDCVAERLSFLSRRRPMDPMTSAGRTSLTVANYRWQ